MSDRQLKPLIACLAVTALLTPSALAAPAQSNNQIQKSNTENKQKKAQQMDQQQLKEKKAREDYEKHVKQAEKAHKKQENQIKNAIFKSNIRKSIEHGRVHH